MLRIRVLKDKGRYTCVKGWGWHRVSPSAMVIFQAEREEGEAKEEFLARVREKIRFRQLPSVPDRAGSR